MRQGIRSTERPDGTGRAESVDSDGEVSVRVVVERDAQGDFHVVEHEITRPVERERQKPGPKPKYGTVMRTYNFRMTPWHRAELETLAGSRGMDTSSLLRCVAETRGVPPPLPDSRNTSDCPRIPEPQPKPCKPS